MWRPNHLYRVATSSIVATLILSAAVFIGPSVPVTSATSTTSATGTSTNLPNFQHVFIIMMENTGIESLLGNPNAPWINQAVQTYGVAGNYYGVTHPSQPNYLASTAGTNAGVPDDNDVTVNEPNIVDQLEARGKTWHAYMQSYALCATPLDHACGNQLYERKHNPFISFQDVQSNPARVANIVDFTQLSTDLANNTVPDYSWISPNQCNDMHGRGAPASDPCSYDNEQLLIAAGDTFLAQTVGAIQASKAWQGNSVIFITWDESDFTNAPTSFGFGDTRGCCDANPGGGHVLTLVISHSSHGPAASFTPYNHYSMLATIEDSWHLGCLASTCDTAHVSPMSDLV